MARIRCFLVDPVQTSDGRAARRIAWSGRAPGAHTSYMPSSTPSGACTTLGDVLSVLRLADRAGVRLWIDGGWGVDALLGGQTREHGDLDVAIEVRYLGVFIEALSGHGFNAKAAKGTIKLGAYGAWFGRKA